MLFTCSNLPHQYIFSTLKITLYTEYKTFKCHTSKQAITHPVFEFWQFYSNFANENTGTISNTTFQALLIIQSLHCGIFVRKRSRRA